MNTKRVERMGNDHYNNVYEYKMLVAIIARNNSVWDWNFK
jgi:hypothetical protein